MAEVLCQALFVNFSNSFELLRNTILQFTPDQWLRGGDDLQVPAKISYHILDALDYYLRENPDEDYVWGHRFGGGWWALDPAEMPTPQDLIQYLEDIEERANLLFFHKLTDKDLSQPFDKKRQHGDTHLEHLVYALRHTMHHHGALSLLSLQFENPEGIWK